MNHYLRALLIALVFAVITLAIYAVLFVMNAAPANQLQNSLFKTLLTIGIFLLATLAIIILVKLSKK